ncbi:hypothetical protein Plec18167_006358 [Paecilomyces lecythidis]|uniref:Uncharacterized protein n=1 Tax=Paecilomyces lecythidis TaxID=3004212 RepID=A0ABR3XBJ9_9EURO
MDDIETNGLPDSPSMELGEIREDAPANPNTSTSAYTADDERSNIPGPFQQPQGPRGRQQRRQQDRRRNLSRSRHRCRCRCGCEACFCDESWPAEDPDRTPRASEHMDLRPDFTYPTEINPENFTDRIYGLGLDDFMEMMDPDDNYRWGTTQRQYWLPEGYHQIPTPHYPRAIRNMDFLDWNKYYYSSYGRFEDPFASTIHPQADFQTADYSPVFHVHDHRHLHRDDKWQYRNQQRRTVPSSSRAMPTHAEAMQEIARPTSYFLNILHLFATLIILYGAVRPYLLELHLNNAAASA